MIVILPDYRNFIRSFEMTLNLKQGTEKLQTKNQRCRSVKNQNTERRKPSFTKRIGRKCSSSFDTTG